MESTSCERIIKVETPVDVPCQLLSKEKSLPDIQKESMAQVFVPERECFVVQEEFCMEETTVSENGNAYFNRSISNVEIKPSSSHMQPALLGTQRLVHEIGNVETAPNSATGECVVKSECSLQIRVKSELCEITALDNVSGNVSTLKCVLSHDNIHQYCGAASADGSGHGAGCSAPRERPPEAVLKTESVSDVADVVDSSTADSTKMLTHFNARSDAPDGMPRTVLHGTDAPSRAAALQSGSGTSSDKDLRTHTGHRPFKCDRCWKTFARRRTLVAHMRFHTENRPFKCDQCPKTYKRWEHLIVHLRYHTIDRPYKCHQCPKSFTQEKHLCSHMRYHTGERPFKCDECPEAFTHYYHLILHRRRHPRDRCFKCVLCPNVFKKRESLVVHMRWHIIDRPFKCHQCQKAFMHKCFFVQHMRFHDPYFQFYQ